MEFSFIISSLGNAQQLQNCIDSIGAAIQTEEGVETEIIVVFQNVKENDCNVKTRYPAICSFHYTDGKGLSRARNYAIERARGDYLIFLDDDARIKEDFISSLAKSCSVLAASAFCGKVMAKGTDNVYGHCFVDNERRYLRIADFRYFMGSSHILRKDVIGKAGLYDERFGAGAKYRGAEETDIFFRLKEKGLKVIYLPELIYYHPWVYSGPKVFDYSYAVGAALAKQVFSRGRYMFLYLGIIAWILFKVFMRVLQNAFFPKSGIFKNFRFHYRLVFLGTLKGIFDYSWYRKV